MKKGIVVLVLLLFSCGNKKKKIYEVISPDKSRSVFVGEIEPQWTGIETIYDSNGSISSVGSYENGLAEGEFYIYKNNILKGIMNYKHNNLNGESRQFYSNGEVKKVIKFSEGKKHGESMIYDSLGTLTEYIYNSRYSEYAMFIMKYGQILEYSGTPFIDIIPDKNYLDDSIYVEKGDTISFNVVVPTPPKCEFIFETYKIENHETYSVLNKSKLSSNEYYLEYVITEDIDFSIKLLGTFCDGKEFEFIVPIKAKNGGNGERIQLNDEFN